MQDPLQGARLAGEAAGGVDGVGTTGCVSSSRGPRTRRLALAALIALAVPVAPAGAHTYPVHQVAPGETLSSIAGANGLQLARLAAANGLPWNGQVTVGQVLQIPPQDGAYTGKQGETLGYATSSKPIGTASTAAAPTSTASGSGSGTSSGSTGGGGGHAVNQGETLSAIAARLGTSIAALAAVNGIANPNLIYAGSTLKAPAPGTTATPAPAAAVPVTVTVSKTATTTSSSTGPEGSAAYQGGGAGNSGERVSSSQVSSIAAQHGVPGSLAAAIAWQESGNNNALTSSTGAKGVMQIMPGTWQWINNQLAGNTLRTHTAADNVKAGSLLLKALLKETGGNEEQAIAGYYQGLNSVRSRGMYDDTKQYVKNVQALRARVGQ